MSTSKRDKEDASNIMADEPAAVDVGDGLDADLLLKIVELRASDAAHETSQRRNSKRCGDEDQVDADLLTKIVQKRASDAAQEILAVDEQGVRLEDADTDTKIKAKAANSFPKSDSPAIVAENPILDKAALKIAASTGSRELDNLNISIGELQLEGDIDIVPAPPQPLIRGQRGVHTIPTPGAQAVYPDTHSDPSSLAMQTMGDMHSQSPNMSTTSAEDEEAGAAPAQQHPGEETLFTATLVDHSDSRTLHERPEIVEAKPAPEGFAAIVRNKRFKYVAALFLLVVIGSIALPLGLLLPNNKNNDKTQTIFTAVDSTLVCGSRAEQQKDYRGTVAVAAGGETCQRWDAQFPHSHGYLPSDFPSSGLEANYCRNPSKDFEAWCYTTNPEQRWSFCGIPMCNETELVLNDKCGTLELAQLDYRGTTSQTATGKTCQRWDRQEPHQHSYNPEAFPNNGLEENFCRNVDESSAWCFTDDLATRWEHCDIPLCGSLSLTLEDNATCADCSPGECGTDRRNQKDYRGTVNTTKGGYTCERWDAALALGDSYIAAFDAEAHGLEQNYCRNPDNARQAWCWTNDPSKELDFCDVPVCADTFVPRRKCGTRSKSQSDYRGDVAVSETGQVCVEWDRLENEKQSRKTHPWDGLVSNYCRNPGGSRPGAWCYVSEGSSPFEMCSIPDCKDCGSKAQNKTDYRGIRSVTRNGQTCQPWEAKWHLLLNITAAGTTYLMVPEEWGLEENYCRNPNNQDNVWCYTDENSTDWEFCDVPDCEEEKNSTLVANQTCGSISLRQADYRGFSNTTTSGRSCQSWSSQEPHAHKYTPEDRPFDGLEHNYCRNQLHGPNLLAWCYTTDADVRWEYCSVPNCEDEARPHATQPDCGSLALQQKDYRGKLNRTADGMVCQRWDSQEPHNHEFGSIPVTALDENFCRNPDGSDKAWCFTMDPDVLWGYCDVAACENDP